MIPEYLHLRNIQIIPTVLFCLLVSLIIAPLTIVNDSKADEQISWMQGNLSAELSEGVSTDSSVDNYDCTIQPIRIVNSSNGNELQKNICIHDSGDFRYGRYLDDNYNERLVISFGNDLRAYNVEGSMPLKGVIPIPNSHSIIFRENSSNPLVMYDNFSSQLTQIAQGNSVREYKLNDTPMTKRFVESPYGARAVGVSNNGKWALVEVIEKGIIRVNLETGEKRFISKQSVNYGFSSIGSMRLAITNDGRHGAILKVDNKTAYIIDMNDSCGRAVTERETYENLPNSCDTRDISNTVRSVANGSFSYSIPPTFSDDNGQLYMWAYNNSVQSRIVVTASGYDPLRLDYIALGDSFSSGEGDIDRVLTNANTKWYKYKTDDKEDAQNGVPMGKCHVSMRSYPYNLAHSMNLKGNAWNTVACSGAQINDVVPKATNLEYMGQGKDGSGTPRLKDFANAGSLKADALNEFIPGRVAQIAFVKKYNPKIITLTMGGNDVGFGDKINSCVWLGSCEYAKLEYRQKLKNELRSMYRELSSLYKNLSDASEGKARIYVLGYPQIINDHKDATCTSTLNLNADERKMIYNSIEYLNNVIEQAAKRVGVKYIDVESAFGNRKLCENPGSYVTGITGLLGYDGNELQESFHPNASGHEALAAAFKAALHSESPLTYVWCSSSTAATQVCPDESVTEDNIPTPANGYFDEGQQTTITFKKAQVTNNQTQKSTSIPLRLGQYSGKPATDFSATLHSDPINLGKLTVNAVGSINAKILIPSTVPVGYHILTLSGQTYSGEPVEYYQTVLVTGTDTADLDENGIVDEQQPCGAFIAASSVDADLDGIDDACDPEVASQPQLYRIRTGDSGHIYSTEPEREDYLYVERNVHASSLTGIVGDDDPDGDGWAIVGASQGSLSPVSSVIDTAPAANFAIIGEGVNARPYVYIRTTNHGCTSFTPSKLNRVKPSQIRILKKAHYNTNKCRQEPSNYDADGDGLPDDEQVLYMARNGDLTKGEDPSRLYLYRNFYAAEAQLGISDYSPVDVATNNAQAWNLLAISNSNQAIPSFNALFTMKDSSEGLIPVILTKKQNGKCIAYQPRLTGVIKEARQKSNYLKKLTNLPSGVECE